MTVVCNASPLINLAHIGQMGLLQQLYGMLLIPEAVWNEVVVEGAGQPGADEVADAVWIQTRSVQNEQLVLALKQTLDAGESEAIALALETEAELVLLDEHLGRATADYLGLRYAGLVGVLIEAKHRGLIPSVRPHLDLLRDTAGFRLRQELYTRVLRDEGEL